MNQINADIRYKDVESTSLDLDDIDNIILPIKCNHPKSKSIGDPDDNFIVEKGFYEMEIEN